MREEPTVRGRWVLFQGVLHPARAGKAIALPGEENVVQLARSEFLYVPGAMPLMVAPFCCQIGAVEARKLAGKFGCGWLSS